LRESVEGLGARFIKAELDVSSGLSGVVRSAKSISGIPDPVAVINACGLSARRFLPEAEASLLYPIRGQTVLVKGEAASSRAFSPASLGKEGCYVIPRPGSGTTILGGLKDAGSYEEKVDSELTGRILERVKRWKLAEELRMGEGGEFEVISEQVGWRPGRKGGPRVEVDGEGRIEGVWVVHAYGHSGGGYQGSVGSAEKVVRLVGGLVGAGSKL
jgi:D-amino-acid oxidase